MKSIIQELQAGATDRNQVVSDLLRKAKIVAVKLDLTDFLRWIENELNGYKEPQDIPSYRRITGEPKGWNPYHGWIPVTFNESRVLEKISTIPNNQPVRELEEVFESKSDTLQIPYPPEAQVTLGKAVGFQTRFALIVSRSSLAGILDAVRNIILDWSLKLEKEGILGEGISFSRQEREKAHEPTTIVKVGKIERFVGNLGTMTDQASMIITQINKETIPQIKDLTEQIKKYITEIDLTQNDKTTVEKNMQELAAEIMQDNPQPSRISTLLGSVKRIMEGASGSIIAQGIITAIDKFL
jgi:hypothetical protein